MILAPDPRSAAPRQHQRRTAAGVLLVSGLLASAACGRPEPGREGSASGPFVTAIARARGGALEIVMSTGDQICDSRFDRNAFLTWRGLRLRLLAAAAVGELYRSDFCYWNCELWPPPTGELAAQDQFAAYFAEDWTPAEGAPEPARASAGTVTLDEPPDYDTGRVKGSFEVTIAGQRYAGTFDTAYCPLGEGVDAAGLGLAMYNTCYGATADIPFAPGSSTLTRARDLERGVRAWGVGREMADCLLEAVAECSTLDPVTALTRLVACNG